MINLTYIRERVKGKRKDEEKERNGSSGSKAKYKGTRATIVSVSSLVKRTEDSLIVGASISKITVLILQLVLVLFLSLCWTHTLCHYCNLD